MISKNDKKTLKKLGEHIAAIRKRKNLSLREVSYACNIDNSKISKIEKGQVNITFTTLLDLARGLEVNPKEFFDFPFE